MSGTGIDAVDAAWWPYLFILVAGGIATNVWRWIGVVAGGSLRDDSELLIWVKCVATALIAAVIGKLIVFPAGSLEAVPVIFRLGAGAGGWLAFRWSGGNVLVGVLCGETLLISTAMLFGT